MSSAWVKSYVLGTFLVLCSILPATAQMKLEPAYPEYAMRGPAAAKGAVVWSHGRSVSVEDSLSPTPFYMLTLRDAGWDAFRFNRMRDGDTLQDSSRALVRKVHELKERGYSRIVLAGQSFGAFLSLMAADASEDVHAVVATAPAAYGSYSEFYDSWRKNASNLYPLLEKVRGARVMLFYFHGDEFDPGGRGDRSKEILAAKNLPYLVIDQPRSLTGHWAASTGVFVRRFASCIRDFVEAASVGNDMDCERSWGNSPSAQLLLPSGISTAPIKKASTAPESPFLGKWYGYYANGREVMLAVDKATDAEVNAVYALGPGVQPGEAAEWVRRSGRMTDDEMIFKERGRNTLRYRLKPDGKLEATWISIDGRTTLDATLRRID